jgi:hypothetical protein
MASLLETMAALAITASTMAFSVATLAASARLHADADRTVDALFSERQLEHLVERAAASAGTGPGRPPPVSLATVEDVVLAADLNGDGTVETDSAETTALEVRRVGREARLRLRLGRQVMTVRTLPDTTARLRGLDRWGHPATATDTALIELTVEPAQGPAIGPATTPVLFAIPAASW